MMTQSTNSFFVLMAPYPLILVQLDKVMPSHELMAMRKVDYSKDFLPSACTFPPRISAKFSVLAL